MACTVPADGERIVDTLDPEIRAIADRHGLPVVEGAAPPETVVCVLTGHGLKDPDTALGKAPQVIGCEADVALVEKAVFG